MDYPDRGETWQMIGSSITGTILWSDEYDTIVESDSSLIDGRKAYPTEQFMRTWRRQ